MTRGQDTDQIQAVSSVQSEGGWITKLQQKSTIVILGASKDVRQGARVPGCRPGRRFRACEASADRNIRIQRAHESYFVIPVFPVAVIGVIARCFFLIRRST